MKLLEILVKELKEWPEDAKYIAQDTNGSIWRYPEIPRFNGSSWGIREPKAFLIGDSKDIAEDYDTAVITREQYEAALQWNGEGLPPVGTECEWQDRNTKEWLPVTIVYSSEWVTVFREKKTSDAVEIALNNYADETRFRPLRTEAEHKRDEAAKKLRTCLAETGFGITELDAKNIYDAIAAGKIPGVKLS